MSADEPTTTRADRRRRTRDAILAAARDLFAELGFERTSIRAVAAEAGIDPGLVMQHFGDKEGLFSAAVASSVDVLPLTEASVQELSRVAASHLFAGFEHPEGRAAAALLRSSLTHAQAGEVLRDEVMARTQAAVAATIGGPDANLRAAILNACTLGVTITRYLLHDPVLSAAEQRRIEEILEPALRAIIEN